MQVDHGVFMQIVDNFIKVVVSVVDDAPAYSPSWKAVDLRDGAYALLRMIHASNLQ